MPFASVPPAYRRVETTVSERPNDTASTQRRLLVLRKRQHALEINEGREEREERGISVSIEGRRASIQGVDTGATQSGLICKSYLQNAALVAASHE
jgi:hypothetical protein